MAASLLDDILAKSYHQGEALMLEKANKIWAIILQQRLCKNRKDAHQRILDGISDLSKSSVLVAMERAVRRVELSRCQSVVGTAKQVLSYGEKIYAESQECSNAFLENSVEAARLCKAAHDRLTSCIMESRTQMDKCVSYAQICDAEGAAKEMKSMWNLFSELESNFVNVKQCFEEKALRDRLTHAGDLPAIHGKHNRLRIEPTRDDVLRVRQCRLTLSNPC